MSDSKLNQGSELNDIVNKRNKWLFTSIEISEYLTNRNNSLLIPSGNIWYSSLAAYPSYSYSLLKLLYFLVKQLFSDKTSFQKKSTHIVFSTGEGHDLKNYNKFLRDSNVEVIHMEAFNTSQKTSFNIVELKLAFSLFLENVQEARSILKLKLPLELRKKIVNYTLPNLALYTYLCAFFSAIKEQIPNVKIFHSNALLLASAATRSGIENVCMYHGSADKTSIASYPFYDHIYVYTSEEKSYFEDISPNSNVCLYPVQELSNLEKKAIMFLPQSDRSTSERAVIEILTFFLKKDYQIFLKKHPTHTGSLGDRLAEAYNLEMLACEADASEIILNLRPSFTIGVGSTALCESLRHGVVPICLDRQNRNFYLAVYPFKERALCWREEKERIFELLEDMSLYSRTLSELRIR